MRRVLTRSSLRSGSAAGSSSPRAASTARLAPGRRQGRRLLHRHDLLRRQARRLAQRFELEGAGKHGLVEDRSLGQALAQVGVGHLQARVEDGAEGQERLDQRERALLPAAAEGDQVATDSVQAWPFPGPGHQLATVRQLRHGAGHQPLQPFAHQGDVHLVTALDVIQKGEDQVGAGQESVQLGLVGTSGALAQALEQRLHQVGELGDVVESEEAGPTLDRVHAAEEAIDAIAQQVFGGFFQGEQIVGDVGQVLLGLADEFIHHRAIGSHVKPRRLRRKCPMTNDQTPKGKGSSYLVRVFGHWSLGNSATGGVKGH